jgi:hypothetical protein
VVERLLFDGIDAKTAGTAVSGEHDPIILPRAYKAHAALPFIEFAVTGAEIALHTAVGQHLPVLRGNCIGLDHFSFS